MLFICLLILVVHIEVVFDFFTDVFMAILDRFVAMLEISVLMQSDCGAISYAWRDNLNDYSKTW